MYEYFYGSLSPQLYPHSFDVKLSEVQVYKIGAPSLPDSCMPLGMKPEENKTKLVQLTPGKENLNSLRIFGATLNVPIINFCIILSWIF